MDEYFGVKIVKAMKRCTEDYLIKTKKIDTKTVIVFGNSKKPDDYYYGKDFLKIKSFEPIAIDINVLMKLLGQPSIDLENEYVNKINVHHLRQVKDKNGKLRTVGYKSHLVPNGEKGSIDIGVHDWPTTDVFWLPSENLINNSYICSKSKECYYTCSRRDDMKKHEKKCKDVQEILSQQLIYGGQNDPVSKLSEIMDIDFSNFRQRHFCCFDIETFGQVCGPVSIAVASTLDGPRYFEKSNDTPEAAYKMICEFIDYLLELQQKLLDNLEPEIERAISFLQTEKDEVFNVKKYQSKAQLNQIYRYFKNYEVLKVFGFNSRFVKNVNSYNLYILI